MNYFKQIPLKQYILYTWDSADKYLKNVNLKYQYIDIWGEVKRLDINDTDKNIIKQKIDNVHQLCKVVYASKNVSEDEKNILKTNEWFLFDFFVWKNKTNHTTTESCIKWFKQWISEDNLKLLDFNPVVL